MNYLHKTFLKTTLCDGSFLIKDYYYYYYYYYYIVLFEVKSKFVFQSTVRSRAAMVAKTRYLNLLR